MDGVPGSGESLNPSAMSLLDLRRDTGIEATSLDYGAGACTECNEVIKIRKLHLGKTLAADLTTSPILPV